MKKIAKIIALVLIVSTLTCLLASCGKTLSGTYSAELSATDLASNIGIDTDLLEALSSLGDIAVGRKFEFSGNKVIETVSYEIPILGEKTESTEYLYKIEKNDEGKYEITFSKDTDAAGSGMTFSFEELDNGSIKIAGITYKKK